MKEKARYVKLVSSAGVGTVRGVAKAMADVFWISGRW